MYKNELELFQRSKESIWTDEHICKTLLEAHLDESHDAASRRPEIRANIINWIHQNIKPASKIIDFGCGPGLYTYELGKLGHNVLGIDFNKASYDYANTHKKYNNQIEYNYCNYLKDTITRKYDAAIMIYCDFGALIPSEQIIILDKIKNILENDGILIFDVFGLSVLEKKQEKNYWYVSQGNDFWSKDPYLLMEETKIFGKENTEGTRTYLIDQKSGKIKEYIMWDQYYNNDSIQKLISENGFEIMEINRDLIKNDETLFIKARKK